jgi:pilus assembly protein CpaB
LKRSNRLILLTGVLLALVAFVGIVVLTGGGRGSGSSQEPTELPTVIAATNIPLGVEITAEMVTTQNLAVGARNVGAYQDASAVIGQTVRLKIVEGQQITAANFTASGDIARLDVPVGKVGMSVQVDQVSGVGTVIKTGDYVDMLVGFTGDKFPVITLPDAPGGEISVVQGLNNTSAKLLVQGMQVLGTLLPPPPPAAEGQPDGQSGTALNGQQQIVIVAASPQQAEVIKFAQLDGSISLVLRAPSEFVDPNDPTTPIEPPPNVTTGVVLRTLIDEYGVLVPQLVEAILPGQAP